VLVVNARTLQPGAPFTMGCAVWILLLVGMMRMRTLAEIGPALESLTSAMLLLLCLKWFVVDGLMREMVTPPPAYWPFANVFLASAGLLALGAVLLRPMRDEPAAAARFMGWWLFGLAFVALNVEVLRTVEWLRPERIAWLGSTDLVQNVALTLLWSLTALGLIVFGFVRKSRHVRFVAFGLFALTVGKIVVVDMANVETILRVISLMLFGIVLFVVSYLYHRAPPNGALRAQGMP
jgi:uncharacterized membrane protein